MRMRLMEMGRNEEDRQPVLIGTGQLVDREAKLECHIEPLAMLERVARSAAEDAGGGAGLLESLDAIAVIPAVGWSPQNAPSMLAGQLGARPKRHLTTSHGGQSGITLLNFVAQDILEGHTDLALITGCNNFRVLTRAMQAGTELPWRVGGVGTPEMIGGDKAGSNELEARYGLKMPVDIYPIFENALRAEMGLTLEEHRAQMGLMFSRFTEVAAHNRYAWFPVQHSAQDLTTVTANNRMIGFPYPKYLNAVMATEQAAGVLVCSVGRAKSLGIARDRWVYWWGGAESEERAWWVSERPDFAQCPSMQDTHISALCNAGVEVDDINYFDFYSCFPVAVEMACRALGLDIDDPRGFTVTGGLPYAGGPASSYTLHSAAEMVARLRGASGQSGLVTGNGWYLTKHSAAVLGSEPKADGGPRRGLIDDLPSRAIDTEPQSVDTQAHGRGCVEAYTVVHDREGQPCLGIVLGRTAEGRRFIANTPDDRDFLEAFVEREQVGATGRLQQNGGRLIFE